MTLDEMIRAALLRHIQSNVDFGAVGITSYNESIDRSCECCDAYRSVLVTYYGGDMLYNRNWEFQGSLIGDLFAMLEASWPASTR